MTSRNNLRCGMTFVLAILILSSCTHSTPKQDFSANDKPIKVSCIEIETSGDAGKRHYVGTVKASKSVIISAKNSGVVEKINISRGSHVTKGAAVVELESETLISALAAAQATYNYADDAMQRVSQVKDAGGVTEQKLVEVKTEYDKAAATLNGARNAVEQCRLKAPFSGVVGEVHVELGENVDAFAPVATILDISSVEIEISVPETEMSSVAIGDMMEVRIAALDGKTLPAKVVSRGIVASPISHTYTCTLVPLEKAEGMLPGMVCSVRSQNSEASMATVPATAVKTDTEGRYVWIAKDGHAIKRHVTISGYSGNDVVVSDGLEEGDMVITAGIGRISTGMNVIIKGE